MFIFMRKTGPPRQHGIEGSSALSPLRTWRTGRPLTAPLFLRNYDGSVAVALFEAGKQPSRATVAFRVRGPDFLKWRDHLQTCQVAFELEDHDLPWSLYFKGPDAAPFEITSYDYDWLKARISS